MRRRSWNEEMKRWRRAVGQISWSYFSLRPSYKIDFFVYFPTLVVGAFSPGNLNCYVCDYPAQPDCASTSTADKLKKYTQACTGPTQCQVIVQNTKLVGSTPSTLQSFRRLCADAGDPTVIGIEGITTNGAALYDIKWRNQPTKDADASTSQFAMSACLTDNCNSWQLPKEGPNNKIVTIAFYPEAYAYVYKYMLDTASSGAFFRATVTTAAMGLLATIMGWFLWPWSYFSIDIWCIMRCIYEPQINQSINQSIKRLMFWPDLCASFRQIAKKRVKKSIHLTFVIFPGSSTRSWTRNLIATKR